MNHHLHSQSLVVRQNSPEDSTEAILEYLEKRYGGEKDQRVDEETFFRLWEELTAKTITIEVWGGMVTDVHNLPVNMTYVIDDKDNGVE